MKNTFLLAITGCLLGNLTACGTATTYFPDKEQAYQHVKEIPMLNWPAELRTPKATEPVTPAAPAEPSPVTPQVSNNSSPELASKPSENSALLPTSPAATTPQSTDSATATTPETTAEPYDFASEIPKEAKPPSDADPVPDDTGDISKPVVIEQIKRDGSSRLRLNVNMLRAWRSVDKALSRNAIEVTNRNPEEHRYTVQYDPNEKKPKDGSFLDEINFMFKGFEIHEQTYRLKLVEVSENIEVELVDEKLKPIVDTAASVKLLDVLEKSIKADFAEAKK